MKRCSRDFPGGPVLRLLASTAGGEGLIPGQGTKVLYAVWCGQNKQTKKVFNITNHQGKPP